MNSPVNLNNQAVFEGAATLLKFGPLGLSALLLVLAVSVLFISFSAPRERLMRQFMYVGAGLSVFFGLLTLWPPTSHPLHLSVQPLDVETWQDTPRPALWINNEKRSQPLDINVDKEMTAILDISQALDFVEKVRSVAAQSADEAAAAKLQLNDAQGKISLQNAALTEIQNQLGPITSQLAQAKQIANEAPKTCAFGGTTWSAGNLVNLTEDAQARVDAVRELANGVNG